jgi:hypothetical protein
MTTKFYHTTDEALPLGTHGLAWRRWLAVALVLAVVVAACSMPMAARQALGLLDSLLAGLNLAGTYAWLAGQHLSTIAFGGWFALVCAKLLQTVLQGRRAA